MNQIKKLVCQVLQTDIAIALITIKFQFEIFEDCFSFSSFQVFFPK